MGPGQRDAHLRETVLRAAVDIVEREGVGALSMREVARRAGVSHQAPYHYFADRASILASIAEEGFNTLADAFHVALTEAGDPSEACFTAYINMAREYPGHFRIMFRPELCAVDEYVGSRVAAERAFGALMQLVRRLAPSDISQDDAFTWAVALWSQAHGFATLLLDGPLLRKLPPGQTVESLISGVARLALFDTSERL
jgi:AcrR family transcriptional regulator